LRKPSNWLFTKGCTSLYFAINASKVVMLLCVAVQAHDSPASMQQSQLFRGWFPFIALQAMPFLLLAS